MGKESFHFICYIIFLLTLAASRSLASTQPRCHEDERSALLEFKTTFFTRKHPCDRCAGIEQAKVEFWNASSGSDCCSWAGVECDKVSGHVIGLHLSCSCLSGEMNSSTGIFHLLHLRSLNLAVNEFNCQIPPAFGNLTQLVHLNLSDNRLFGTTMPLKNLTLLTHLDLSLNSFLNSTIPSYFGSILKLEHLSLLDNEFGGEIPSSFGRLCHLKHLDLGYNSLTGEVPSFLGNLVQLKYLSLEGNMLAGKIPSSLGNLIQLTFLDLSYNQLTGEIPSFIGNLVQLTDIDLYDNQLVGEIPLSFQNLMELRSLSLGSNQLSGEIPFLLGRLTQLIDVDLSLNQFQGPVLTTIFQLQSLRALYLGSNNLSGTLKFDTFSEAKNLQDLDLSFNKLSLIAETNITNRYSFLGLGSCNLNSFPEFLQDQNDLSFLDLSYNNISGQVPKWFLNVSTEYLEKLYLSGNFLTSFAQDPVIFSWKKLFEVDLSFNDLQGSIPIPPPEITYYFISNNMLSGGISPLICNLSFLLEMDISDNDVTGFLPQCLSRLGGHLEVMNLKSNKLTGKIPKLNGNFCWLHLIDLSNNKLEGPLPRSLRNCSKLEFLNFANNQIRDAFPSWMGSLPRLEVLILRHNRFHGLIGEQADGIDFPMLQIIDLSQNSFYGSLPSKYFKHWTAMNIYETKSSNYMGDLDTGTDYSMSVIAKGIPMNYSKIQAYLSLIDFSSNNFSGVIPETIGSLKQLKLLNLSNNKLFGPLPRFLANLTNLESLDLSRNLLSGEIPQELTQLTSLAVFNLSYNRLTGPIPLSRQFDTFENNSYNGNTGLCGTPLSRKCRDPKAGPPSSPTSEEDEDSGSVMGLDWKIVCMGYASGLVIGVVLGNTLITARRAQALVKKFGRRNQRRRR